MKWLIASSILLLLLTACSADSIFEGVSRDSGYDAVMEEAAMALDDQNYDKAISLLAEVYDTTALDPAVSRLLGSAYMGKTGIHAANLIGFSAKGRGVDFNMVAETLSLFPAPELDPLDRDEDKNDQDCDIQNLTVLVTSAGAQFIDGECAPDYIEYLDKAKRVFLILHRENKQTPEDAIQYGIVSAVHFVLAAGNAVADALNMQLATKPGTVPVPINKEAYRLYRDPAAKPWGRSYNWAARVDAAVFDSDPDVSVYQNDMINVHHAVEAFGSFMAGRNDVQDRMEAFLRDIIGLPDGEITEETIVSNLTSVRIFNYLNDF